MSFFGNSVLLRFAAFIGFSILSIGSAIGGEAPRKIHILAIGNSFSENAVSFLPQIAAAAKKDVKVTRATIGGGSLQAHATYLRAAQKGDSSGAIYDVGKAKLSLLDILASDNFDFVTIQQWSRKSFDPASFEPYAHDIITAISNFNPLAEVLVHETWAYREDYPDFQGEFNQKTMYKSLRFAYRTFAEKNHYRIIPSGDAFQLARGTKEWTFVPDENFDFEIPPPGALPKESGSLNAGWHWTKDDKGTPVLSLDAIHCNIAGCYLASCVWYLTLFREDKVPTGFKPKELTLEQAASLRKIAETAVANERAYEATWPKNN